MKRHSKVFPRPDEYITKRIRIRKGIMVLTAVMCLLLFSGVSATSGNEPAKGRDCNLCHMEGDLSKLNERGRYFLKNDYTFEGYPGEVKDNIRGEELYNKYCRSCHGDVDPSFRYSGINDAVVDAIKSGRMPPRWVKVEELSDKDVTDLAHYVGNWCNLCHEKIQTDLTPRELSNAPENHQFSLEHGNFWCFACHNPENRDSFILINGSRPSFREIPVLCSQCHGVTYKDWKNRIHGRWVGNISSAVPDAICTDCHNPHDVNPAFEPIKPEKPPEKPPVSKMPENYRIYTIAVIMSSLILVIYSAWRD